MTPVNLSSPINHVALTTGYVKAEPSIGENIVEVFDEDDDDDGLMESPVWD